MAEASLSKPLSNPIVNSSFAASLERLGCFIKPLAELFSALDLDQVHPEDRSKLLAIQEAPLEGAPLLIEFRSKSDAGSWRWQRLRAVGQLEQGKLLVVGIHEDITESMEKSQTICADLDEAARRFDLAESVRAAELLASAAPDLGSMIQSVLSQASLCIPYSSAAVYAKKGSSLEFAGGSPDHLPGETLGEPVKHRLEEAIQARSPIASREAGTGRLCLPLVFRGIVMGALDIQLSCPEGEERDYTWPAMIFGDMLAVRLESETRRRELVARASTDTLTGLLTRRSFSEIAAKVLGELSAQEAPVALLLADIDRFKSFNDRFGHLRGDEVLKGVADSLKEGLRQGDFICRFGGEEIVALLPGASPSMALEVAERLRSRLETKSFDGIQERVTASFGVACRENAKGQRLEELIEDADRAMYEAKEAGRNRVALA